MSEGRNTWSIYNQVGYRLHCTMCMVHMYMILLQKYLQSWGLLSIKISSNLAMTLSFLQLFLQQFLHCHDLVHLIHCCQRIKYNSSDNTVLHCAVNKRLTVSFVKARRGIPLRITQSINCLLCIAAKEKFAVMRTNSFSEVWRINESGPASGVSFRRLNWTIH